MLLITNSEVQNLKQMVKWLLFMTSHDSVNFFLQFNTVYWFLCWRIRILAFSFFLTWESTNLLNLTNYFHHFSLGLSKLTHSNDSPSTEACILAVSNGSSHKKWKIKEFDFGNFDIFASFEENQMHNLHQILWYFINSN